MKTNAISNVRFSGLFTDKSKENGGNWRMEYRPYSWEGKTKAPKVHLDIYSSHLPSNEEIYIDWGNYKASKDILGTVSYFDDKRNGRDIVRKTITDMPPMNLEESLIVKDQKLKVFADMKSDAMKKLKEPLLDRDTQLINLSNWHSEYVADVKRSLGSHVYEKYKRANGLKNEFDKTVKLAEKLGDNFEKYVKLAESSEEVNNQREHIRNELDKIKEAKKASTYIDISRRDIEDANELLKKAFQHIENAKKMLFALSDRTITGQEIINGVGKEFSVDKAIAYVERLMMKKI